MKRFFNLIQDRNEREFEEQLLSTRNDHKQYKHEIEVLQKSIRTWEMDYQELRAEKMALKEISEHRGSDIVRLRREIDEISKDNRRIQEDSDDCTREVFLNF